MLIVCEEGDKDHEADTTREDDVGHLKMLIRATGGEEEDVGWSGDYE